MRQAAALSGLVTGPAACLVMIAGACLLLHDGIPPRQWRRPLAGLAAGTLCGLGAPPAIGSGLALSLGQHDPLGLIPLALGCLLSLPQQWRWACKIADRPRAPLTFSCSCDRCRPGHPCQSCALAMRWMDGNLP